MEGVSDKLFCCSWVRRRVPLATRDELYHILKMTAPLFISRVLHYLPSFVITMFCGRLGNEVFAGYGLACATINVSTVAVGYGLGLACSTLISQTFGGKNLLRVGVILQRGIIILLLYCLPSCGILLNGEVILLYMGQDPKVSRIAQLYMTALIPGLPAIFLYHLQVCYLQNQGIILPQAYAAIVANIANLLTNYILIHWLDLGVSGSAAANTLSHVYTCTFLLVYIWWKKIHIATWGGWSMESLQEWGSYMKLAVPSTLMTCFEWWIYDFGGFFAGMMSENELAAQHATMMVSFVVYMVPLGIQGAACARVGNHLGAGDTAKAILTSKMVIILHVCTAVTMGVVIVCCKNVLGGIFTSDENIKGLVSQMMNVYVFLQCFDGLVCVCTGIFLGTGRQKIPAVANLIGYYGIGLSMIVILMFVAKLRIMGFWIGLLTCVVIQAVFYTIVIFKLNWEKMTEEAVKRAHKNAPNTLLSTAEQTVIASSVDGYGPVETKDPDTETKGEHQGEQSKAGHLTTAQLILRRGLVFLAAVLLLAVGVIVHFLVPLPEIAHLEPNATFTAINTTYGPDQIFSTILVPGEESG